MVLRLYHTAAIVHSAARLSMATWRRSPIISVLLRPPCIVRAWRICSIPAAVGHAVYAGGPWSVSGPSRADIRAVQQIKNVVRILFGSVFLLGAAHVPEDREALLRAGDVSAERGREPRLPKRVVIPSAW